MKKQLVTTYEEAVEYLFAIPRFTGKNSIEDTKAFLHKLGDPDKELSIIHVAGTNGKGSVCAYMRSVLETAGKRVCMFTSPHLVEVTERFYICGKDVEKEGFLGAFLQIYEMLDWKALEEDYGYHPSFFEYLFFMAMLLFREAGCDVCILETGLGGRLDATNSVSTKALSVITSISLDHMEYLGDTVEKIASEKAGIMMKGVPAVVLHREQSVSDVFCEKAEEIGNALYFVSKERVQSLKKGNKSIAFSISTDYYKDIRITLRTLAIYQVENALLAIKALELWDKNREITPEILQEGLKKCFWQGRMEEVLPEVYVDGAHNEDGVKAFLETVEQDGFKGTRSLLVSVVKDKDYPSIFKEIVDSKLFTRIVTAPIQSGRALSKSELKESIERCASLCGEEISFEALDTVPEALEELLRSRLRTERIYVAGSLYLVGEVKGYLREQDI